MDGHDASLPERNLLEDLDKEEMVAGWVADVVGIGGNP
jgi:hypothetical protein